MTRLLSVEDLTIAYGGGDHWTEVVHGVTFDIKRGETLGFVGESGSGKSTVAYRLLGYRSTTSRVDRGKIVFDGRDILSLDAHSLRGLRGKRIALVPQNPTSALSPAMQIHAQLRETIATHDSLPPGTSMEDRVAELLALVGLPDVRRIGRRYPHELSGGQQQRVAIAMAISCDPDLLVLDEPTTGLDVTTQRQIVNLLTSLRDRIGMAMFYVTHDLALLAQIADRIGVMYAGNLVEMGPAVALLSQPVHAYTQKLIASIPRIDDAAPPMPEAQVSASQASAPLLSLKNVDLGYHAGGTLGSFFRAKTVPIAADIDLDVRQGEIVAVVGESGSGKSTIARAIAGQLAVQSGSISFDGEPLEGSVASRPRAKLRAIQYIFQNPDSSLNPRRRIRQILLRPLRHFGLGGGDGILREMLEKVRLKSDYLDRFPRQLSGGECQRIAIARALVVNPRLLICDEILSALDVSVQSSVLEVLTALREQDAVSLLFISHDLAVVRQFADRVVVLYAGRVMQAGSIGEIFDGPQHPYTAMLLAAVPRLVKDKYALPTSPASGPRAVEKRGCPFVGRCPRRIEGVCATVVPPRQETSSGYLQCHIPIGELEPRVVSGITAGIQAAAI